MKPENGREKTRVNISIPADVHQRLKVIARTKGSNVSQLITDLVRNHLGVPMGMAPIPDWPQRIPLDTLERIERYAMEHHTSPEQAVTDWIWKAKVSDTVMKGQLSFR